MAMMLGEAVGRISLDASQLFGEAKRVESTLTNLDGTAGRASGGFTRLANGMAGLGTALLVPMGIGLKSAVDLEHAVQGINASLGGLPQGQLDALTEELQRVGTESQYSATEVAAVADELARAGFAFEDIVGGQMTEAVVNLSQATGTDLMTSVSGVTSVMNLWSQEIVGVENAITSASQAADIFTIAANESSAEVGDIIAGVRNLGPGMTAIGGSFEETAAAIALFTNNGLKAADSGVSMQRAIENLTQPTAEAQELMNQLGISAFDLEGNFVGLPVLFDQLHDSMADMTPEARQMALSTIFGAEAIDVMTLAVLQGGDPLRALIGLMDESGVAAEQSALRMDTLRGQWETLKEGVGTLLGSLVSGLIPGLRGLVDVANAVVDVLSRIPAPIKTAMGAFFGLLAGVAAVTQAMRAWQALDMFLGGGTKRAGMLGLGAMGPVLLGLAAVVGVAAAAIKFNLFGIGDAVEAFRIQWQGMSQMRNPVSAFLDSLAAALRTFNVPLFDRIARGLNTVSNALEDFTDYAGAITHTRTTMNKLLDDLPKPLQTFARGLGILVDTSRDFLEYWRKDGIMGVLQGIPDEVGDIGVAFGTMAMGMQPLFQALAVRFPRFADSFLTLRNAMYPLANVFRETGLALRALFQGDWDTMLTRLGNAGTAFVTFGGMVRDAAISALSELGDIVGDVAVSLGNVVLDVADWVIGQIPDVWAWLRDTALPAIGSGLVELGTILVNVAGWAWSTAVSLYESLKLWIYDQVGGGGEGQAGDVISAVRGVTGISIGTVAVAVAGWLITSAENLHDRLMAYVRGLIYGNGAAGGGAAAASALPGGGINIGDVAVMIGGWALSTAQDIGTAIMAMLTDVAVELSEVAVRIVTWGDPVFNEEIDTVIEDALGTVLVSVTDLAVQIDTVDLVTDAATIAAYITAAVVGLAIVVPAITVSLPVLLTIGAITGGVLLALQIAEWILGWARRHPVDAAKVLVNINLELNEIIDSLPSSSELIEWALNKIVPGSGTLVVNIPTAIEFVTGGGDDEVEVGGSVTADMAGVTAAAGVFSAAFENKLFPAMRQAREEASATGAAMGTLATAFELPGERLRSLVNIINNQNPFEGMPLMAQNSMLGLLLAVNDGLTAVTSTIQTKSNEWGTAISGALAQLNNGGPAAAGAGMGGGAAGLLGGLQASVSAGMASVTATITTSAAQWGVAMTAATTTLGTSAAIAFQALQTSAQTGMSMATSAVSSGASQMSAALLGQLAGMQAGALVAWGAIANAAQSGGSRMAAAAAAASAATAQTIQAGMAFATAAVQSNASRWPGIISGYAGAMRSAGFSVGAAAGQGVAAGLLSTLGMVQAAASAIISTVAGAMTAAAMIASPSKLTAYIGEMMGMGLISGMQAMQPRIAAASAAMIQTATPYTPGAPATYSYGGSTTNAPITIRNVDIHTQGKLSQDDKLQLARDFAESLRDGIDIVYTSHGAGS